MSDAKLTYTQRIDLLIEEADALFKELFECKHRSSEHGNCSDCMNTGILASSKDDFDFGVAIGNVAVIGRRLQTPAPSSSAPTPEMENRCACGRLDLGKYDGLGSTDPKDGSRGSHSRSQCYDMQQRRLPSSSAPKEPDNANL